MSRQISLLWKTVAVTSAGITILLGLAGWLVQRYAVSTTSQALQEEVNTSLRAYQSLWQSRAQMLASVSLILSNMSDVRAAFGTGDQATIRDTAGELWAKLSQGDAIFVVTDPQGGVVASLGGKVDLQDMPIVRSAALKFPQQGVGFMREAGALYQVVVSPVYVESQRGPALLNVLVAGFPVTDVLADTLKAGTGSDFIFSAEGRVIASTSGPGPIAPDDATLVTPLTGVEGKPLGELRIVRSFSSARERIAALRRNLLVIWVLAIAVGFLLSYALARRIVDPIQRLERAVSEVAHRNYGLRVPVEGGDELGRLAASFNTMCASIEEAREELIRQERLATIGHLSTSIVHDLRNPLAAIYGGSEMLVDGDLPPAQVKRLANNIYRGSRRIQELLQDLLDVSRRRSESPEMCRLLDLVNAAAEPLLPSAQLRRIEIEIAIPAALELPLERARMERVFFNLCSNSLEALPDGGHLSITAALNGPDVMIKVRDNGPGVAEQIQSKLFQPFVTAGKKNGLGLGLALSRQTVLSHGGEIWAEPISDGACFCVRLPAGKLFALTEN